MSKVKIFGLENWELPEPGQSREAKEAEKFRKEQGLDGVSIVESAEGKAAKAEREKLVLGALGIKLEEVKKDLKIVEGKIAVLKESLDLVSLKEQDLSSFSAERGHGFFLSLAEKNGFGPEAAHPLAMYFEGGISQDTLLNELISLIK